MTSLLAPSDRSMANALFNDDSSLLARQPDWRESFPSFTALQLPHRSLEVAGTVFVGGPCLGPWSLMTSWCVTHGPTLSSGWITGNPGILPDRLVSAGEDEVNVLQLTRTLVSKLQSYHLSP